MTQAITGRLRARRTAGSQKRTYRLANSIRLPFAIGAASFIIVALGTALLVGRVEESDLAVPGAVRGLQMTLTEEVAQSVRRGVNEGVDDVEQLARELDGVGGLGASDDTATLLQRFVEVHGRYDAAYVVDEERRVLAAAGTASPAPEVLPDRVFEDVGLHLELKEGVATIAQFAPMAEPGRSVVAHYNPVFVRAAMGVAAPGDAWLVTRDGLVITGLGTAAPGTRLSRADLDRAAVRAGAGRDGASVVTGGALSRDVLAWTPVRGVGFAGNQDWGVVTLRRVDAAGLGAPTRRAQAVGLAAALALTAIALFVWLRNVILRPLLDLQQEAERLAYGDLSAPVSVERYDEIGMTARALERIRVLLIRHRMRGR